MSILTNHILIVDFSGQVILSDSKRTGKNALKIVQNNILNITRHDSKEELLDLFEEVKNGETFKFPENKPFFKRSSKYRIEKISPVYKNNEAKYVLVNLTETEKEIYKKQLKLDDNKFEHLFNNARDAIFVTDIDGNYIEVNQTAIERTGFNREKFLELNIKNTPIQWSSQTFANYFQEMIVFEKSTALINYIKPNGEIVETEISGKKFIFNGMDAILHISREVSERNEQYADELDALVQSGEEEKTEIAHEINDVLGPNLSLLKMYLESVDEDEDKKKRNNNIRVAKSIIEKSINTVISLSNKISPRVLKDLGLKTALESYIKNTQQSSEINYNFQLDFQYRLDEKLEIVCYRIVTDILTIFSAMTESNKIVFSALKNNEKLVFQFSSKLIDFDIKKVVAEKSNKNVLNILNRIKSIKGGIDFDTKPNEKTVVKIEIPI